MDNNNNNNNNQLCEQLSQKTRDLELILPDSYHFHKLEVIGSGGFGAIFDSGYVTEEGRRIVRKVDKISSSPIRNGDNFKLFKSVDYELTVDTNGPQYHLIGEDYNGNSKRIRISNNHDALRLQKGVFQYETLRRLKGERNFQQIINNPDTNMDRQFFFLGGDFYVEFSAEYLPGETLRGKMPLVKKRNHNVVLTGLIYPKQFIKVAYDISKAQEILREKRIIHGDIKPENVLLSDNNSKLIDFGNAEFYRNIIDSLNVGRDTKNLMSERINDSITGTLGLLAPELLAGSLPTHRSDAYSAGAMYIQGLVGELPYLDYSKKDLFYLGVLNVKSDDFETLFQKVLTRTDYNPDILRPLVSLCHPEPKKREISDVIEITQRALSGEIPLQRNVRVYIPINNLGFKDKESGVEANEDTYTNQPLETIVMSCDPCVYTDSFNSQDFGVEKKKPSLLQGTWVTPQRRHYLSTS
ncbi:protein kinase [Candidatus Woesearchaeota archaeon]|nr:protein kinase [Candidatus Woesearchaeota archaeon]